jgi:hypothetical protein
MGTLSPDGHIGVVGDIFTTICPRYYFLNHLVCFRRDVATGTAHLHIGRAPGGA